MIGFGLAVSGINPDDLAGIYSIHKHPLSALYRNMRRRCVDRNSRDWPDYGGRGVTVCERWLETGGDGFRNFVKDMGHRPDGSSLDRIDNNKGYEPQNCRWASAKTQVRNRGVTVTLEFDGQRLSLGEWSEKTGIKVDLLYQRFRRGCSAEKILSKQYLPKGGYRAS